MTEADPASEMLEILKFNWEWIIIVILREVRPSPLGIAATIGLLYQHQMIDSDYGAVGGMKFGKGNRSTRRKPAPVPLCPPQFPHDLTSARTRAAEIGSQRLTAWAVAWPNWQWIIAQ
jgi:hypothetical protein